MRELSETEVNTVCGGFDTDIFKFNPFFLPFDAPPPSGDDPRPVGGGTGRPAPTDFGPGSAPTGQGLENPLPF